VDACARSGNSRRLHPRARRRSGSAPIRIAALPLALILHSGCSLDTPEERAACRAAQRYLAALSVHDDAAIREHGTCDAATGSIRGATLIRSGRIRSLSRHSLDSLTANALENERQAGADWSRAVEGDADSLWLRLDAARRVAAICRSASLAAERSASSGSDSAGPVPGPDSAATLRVCASSVRIRWAGPLVGPQPVDREHVLRALAASGGRWIVFSLEQTEDDGAAALGTPPPEFSVYSTMGRD
jgi:hypothetical protein